MSIYGRRAGRFDTQTERMFEMSIPAGCTVRARLPIRGNSEHKSLEFEFKTSLRVMVEDACYILECIARITLAERGHVDHEAGLAAVQEVLPGVYVFHIGT